MTPTLITVKNGKARPVNPFDEYQTNVVGDSTWKRTQEWKEFESTVQWHDCPEATEDGEYLGELIQQWQIQTGMYQGNWCDITHQYEKSQLNTNGYRTRQIWRIASQPQEKQNMEKIAVKITSKAQFLIFESERLRLGYKRFSGGIDDIIGWYGFEFDWSYTALGSEKYDLKGYKLIGFKEWDELYKLSQPQEKPIDPLTSKLINAAKYGYEYHRTTQFPELSFNENCINNFLQYLQGQYPVSAVEKEEAKTVEVLQVLNKYCPDFLPGRSEPNGKLHAFYEHDGVLQAMQAYSSQQNTALMEENSKFREALEYISNVNCHYELSQKVAQQALKPKQ